MCQRAPHSCLTYCVPSSQRQEWEGPLEEGRASVLGLLAFKGWPWAPDSC